MKKIVCVDKRKYVFWGRKKGRHNQKRKYIWPLHRALRKKDVLRFSTEICNTVEIKCPENYSFVENTEEFIMHLNKAKEQAKNWKIVDFNLRSIKQLSFDALCLLMAETRNKAVFGQVKWSIPKNEELRFFFERSGFIKRFKSERNSYCEWEMFNYVSEKSLSPELSKHIIGIVQKYVFGGIKQRCNKQNFIPSLLRLWKILMTMHEMVIIGGFFTISERINLQKYAFWIYEQEYWKRFQRQCLSIPDLVLLNLIDWKDCLSEKYSLQKEGQKLKKRRGEQVCH